MKLVQIRKIPYPGITSGLIQYLVVITVIALTALICKPLSNQQSYHIVSFILLFEVSMMAFFLGIGPVLLASTLSAVVWNYYFIPPHLALHIEKAEDKLMFGSFFIIALLNGVLTNRIRRQEKLALEREERTNAIFELTRDLMNANGTDEILEAAIRDAKKYFYASSIALFQLKGKRMELIAMKGEKKETGPEEIEFADHVFRNYASGSKISENFETNGFTYFPLSGKRLSPGVIAVKFEKPALTDKEIFLTAFITQISIALERELLGELALKARMLDESDKLYRTLFNLISHEFRIPIATIMGSSDTLLMSDMISPDGRVLSEEIFKASARLNHLIENLLNMSRLESGKVSLRLDWCEINDLLYKVTQVLSPQLEHFNLVTEISSEMPLVKLDFALMEQVIYNLILNSCQYSPQGSEIRFMAKYSEGCLKIIIEDNGPGFPPEFIGRLFSKFSRSDSNKAGGLGLGLSIVKGLVEAHNGTVSAENIIDGGARISVTIPSEIPDMNKIDTIL